MSMQAAHRIREIEKQEQFEGRTVAEVLEAAVTPEDHRRVAQTQGLTNDHIAQTLCGKAPTLGIEVQRGEDWIPERRLREFAPETTDVHAIWRRLRMLQEGDTTVLAPPLPKTILDTLDAYIKSGHICVEKNDDALRVTCLKGSGIYHAIVSPAVGQADNPLRRIGNAAREVQQTAGDDVRFSFQNLGDIPRFVPHPRFAILAELERRFGLQATHLDDPDALVDRYDHAFHGYPPTSGTPDFVSYVLEAAEKRAREYGGKNVLREEDIIPTTGAADALGCMRMALGGQTRILHTLPGYPVLAQMELLIVRLVNPEAKVVGTEIQLDRETEKWAIDFDDIERKLADQTQKISVISIIHPSNPTGHVWSESDLTRLLLLAKKYGVIVESDETYWQMVAPGVRHISAGVLAAKLDVPVVVHRSASKDALKCGDKVGVAEIYNPTNDPRMEELRRAFLKIKMQTLGAPASQSVVAAIYQHPEYPAFIRGLNEQLLKTARCIASCFEGVPGVRCVIPDGALLYTTIIFDENVLRTNQRLHIENDDVRTLVEQNTAGLDMPLDERFLHYLIGQRGIVASPLSGFMSGLSGSRLLGFRVCNFETDEARIREIYGKIADAVREYLSS